MIEAYNEYKKKFYSVYESVADYINPKFVLPFWIDINFRLSQHFMPFPRFDFLKHSDIAGTMYSNNVEWATRQLEFLKTQYDESNLITLLREVEIGQPHIAFPDYQGSCNTVHHLFHMTKMRNKLDLKNNKNIVEIGGGYGRLPLTLQLMYTELETYTIIDLPIFTAVQWLYLSTVLGEDKINLVTKHHHVEVGKINLVPVGLIEKVTIENDLFIGMWSLSETTPEFFELIKDTNFINSTNKFCGFHAYEDKVLPSGKLLYDIFSPNVEETEFAAGHYYGWK